MQGYKFLLMKKRKKKDLGVVFTITENSSHFNGQRQLFGNRSKGQRITAPAGLTP